MESSTPRARRKQRAGMPAGISGKALLCRTHRRHTAPRRLTHAARRAGVRTDGPAVRGPASRAPPRGSPPDRAVPAPPGADGAGRNPTSSLRRQWGCCGAAESGAVESSPPESTQHRAHRSSPLVPPAAVAVRGAGRPVRGRVRSRAGRGRLPPRAEREGGRPSARCRPEPCGAAGGLRAGPPRCCCCGSVCRRRGPTTWTPGTRCSSAGITARSSATRFS